MPITRDIPGRIIPFHRCAGALNMAIDQVLLESVDRTQRPTLRFMGGPNPHSRWATFNLGTIGIDIRPAEICRWSVGRPEVVRLCITMS